MASIEDNEVEIEAPNTEQKMLDTDDLSPTQQNTSDQVNIKDVTLNVSCPVHNKKQVSCKTNVLCVVYILICLGATVFGGWYTAWFLQDYFDTYGKYYVNGRFLMNLGIGIFLPIFIMLSFGIILYMCRRKLLNEVSVKRKQ